MKKILTKLIFFTALVAIFVPSVIFAAGREVPSIDGMNGILPSRSVWDPSTGTWAIPTGDLEENILPAAIKMFLGVVATISFVMFIYSGVNLIISQGNEEEMTKFKNMLIWSVVGLVVITMAYAIVKGVLDLNFEV